MRGKRGAAHFEMIISFLFFVTFVFFLFVYLKPYDTTTLSGAVITGLYDSLDKNVSTDLTNVFVEVTQNYTDCFYVEFKERVFTYDLTESIAKTVNNEHIDSNLDTGIDKLSLGDPNNNSFYQVAISPVFVDENIICNINATDSFNHGDVLARRVWSYDFLKAMSDRYYNDYNGLKADMRIPDIFDFAVVSTDLPELNMITIVPDNGDVLANQYILEVLYSDTAEVVNAEFTLMVW